jgi:trk system potassium uptake protein TrkA
LPKEVIIGCILRGDATMIPRGDTRILAGDMLVVISSDEQEMAAIRELTGR